MSSQEEKTVTNSMRRATRLAAVQALYQIELSPEPSDVIMRRLCEDPSTLLQEDEAKADIDITMLSEIVSGVKEYKEELDNMIAQAVDARLSAARMEPILKAILRSGVFELWRCSGVSEKVIINDYLDVAHGFSMPKSPGLLTRCWIIWRKSCVLEIGQRGSKRAISIFKISFDLLA